MKTSELIEARMPHWRELEVLCGQLESKRRQVPARRRAELSELYRAACADLALADAYQLPPGAVRYLHGLVGRAHNQLYRSHRFDLNFWWEELSRNIPYRMFHDSMVRIAFCLFWGGFFASMFLASGFTPLPRYAERLVGAEHIYMYEQMYAEKIGSRGSTGFESGAFGFYVSHNTGIGLRCFAMGLLLGVGGLLETLFNAVFLGAVFGHMTTTPHSDNFFEFVTAHGPFELTAIILSAAAGMRLGFSLVDTRGASRSESLRRAASEAMPNMGVAMLLFFFAGMIEAFVSPSPAPYEFKAAIATISTLLMLLYFVVLGYSVQPEEPEQAIASPFSAAPVAYSPAGDEREF